MNGLFGKSIMLHIDIHKTKGDFTLSVQHTFSKPCIGIVGPSGSGKSTLLHLIAGLSSPDRGCIRFQETVLFDANTNLSPQKRHIGYVRQTPLLFPHMSVLQNLQFANKHTKAPSSHWQLPEIIEMFSLSTLLHRSPLSLSGGEKQKVALARALSASPKMLLLDEPMVSLDESTAQLLLADLISIKSRVPMLYVSHNIQRVQNLCDDILYLKNGTFIPSPYRDKNI